MSIKAWQESDGSDSMRRVLAALYGVVCFEQLQLSVIYDNKWGFFGAVLCAGMVLILLGMTTIESVIGLIKAMKEAKVKG